MAGSSGVDISGQIDEALMLTLQSPHGRLALLWAMDLRLATESEGMNSPFDPNPHVHAFQEGRRSHGQETLNYIRERHHEGYQAMMRQLLDIQQRESLQEEA